MKRFCVNTFGALVLLLTFQASTTSIATIFPTNYDLPKQSGLFLVKNHGKFGFVDRGGKVVVPLEFEDAHPFAEGLARSSCAVTDVVQYLALGPHLRSLESRSARQDARGRAG
jgi:hypothetical protein